MNNNNNSSHKSLRQQAEERLKLSGIEKFKDVDQFIGKPGDDTDDIISKLIHELKVTQIELEIQNEELQLERSKAAIAIEQFSGLYDEIYNFSPVGYFTLSQSGTINDLNVSAIKLLGKEKSFLINHNFEDFISREKRDIFRFFLKEIFASRTRKTCEVCLVSSVKSPVYVYLEGIFSENKKKCLVTAIDITENKMAEIALKESEEIFSQFLEHSPIYVFFKDENIRTLRLSRNYENMLGRPLNELLGETMDELFPSDLSKKMIEDDLQILRQNKKIIIEEEFDGRYFSTIKFPIHLEGKPSLLAGFTIDITENKKAENTLKINEEKYRKLHESLRDGYVYVSMDGVIRESNKAYQEMLGYTEEELEKLSYLDLTPEKWHNFENKIVADEIIPSGFSHVYEKEYIKKDGAIIPVELRTFLIKHDSGQPQGMWAIVRDISQRKHAEEALKASEEKFKSIVESSPTAMHLYKLRDDGQLLMAGANPAADKIIGISHHQLIGKTIEEAFPNLVQTEIPALYKKVAAGEIDHHSFEIEYYDERFSGFYNVHVFKTGFNTIAVDFIDITEKRKTDELLRQNQARLLELNATKDKFFSIIAHDLKNPFNSILGFSQMLIHEAKYLENNSVGNYASLIHSASQHTYKLLENLLTWSRMQSGKVYFETKSLFLDQLIADEFVVAKHIAHQKNIVLKSDVPKNFIIEADENMIRNILRNLISNAIKFTPKNGIIQVDAKEQNKEILISVTDNGLGMTPETIEKLFKIETSFTTRGTENEKGTGLGLLLCKEFVEKHGGQIWVESELNKGSKFYFTIPKT